ncbi:MAG TPA: minichromosome maintenance protein MCM [Methanococcaceae archaeon]|uniref:Minichromosome maintenance protein MCM n=1 Tax=Methanothermococcus okinawensis TaxID=155863 RepID=A0A832ZKN6_9EURY|nr:minichromosome maintenance protein MCM [Methanococcaceae archaeon]HIP91257.1 minichromosome maintenance protein MCM [Methanothermococcus okinawensis]
MVQFRLEYNEKEFLEEYSDKIKFYIKHKLAEDGISDNIFIFDIKDFLRYFPDASEIINIVEEYPLEIENTLFYIFKEAYIEMFGIDTKIEKELEKIQISIRNPIGCEKKIEEISAFDINKLVEFEGDIISATRVRALLKKAYFICRRCGEIKKYTIADYFKDIPRVVCKDCNEEMVLDFNSSTYVNIQELEIQQPIDLMKNPDDPPKSIKVFLENSRGIYSGRVKVVGTVLRKATRSNLRSPIFEICVRSNSLSLIESYQRIEVKDILKNLEVIDTLDELGNKKNIVEILSNYLLYQIRGYDIVKKAIFLQQIKGCMKFLPDGTPLRRDSHILLITDPGIGKSTMLRRIARLLPQNSYASVTTATGGGLTANVVRESTDIGDGWVVKPGVLVKANEGTACIDELTVDKNVMKYILEAMESQTIHVNKGGINAKLPARCAILAACNPRRGRFDPNLGVVEQIDISPPVLSRFDLIFPLRDIPDKKKDEEIAEHILNIHIEAATKKYSVLKPVEIDGIVVDEDLLRSYIIYARTCTYFEENLTLFMEEEDVDVRKIKNPYLTKSAKKIIKDFYLDMRKLGEEGNPIPVTARQLEAIIRIAEMHAKARLAKKVEEKDAKAAIEIIQECLNQVAYDPETGKYDIGKAMGQLPKSKYDKMDRILEIIEELSALSKDGLAAEEDIIERASEFGISEKEVEELLEKLKRNAEIYSPRFGYYRVT